MQSVLVVDDSDTSRRFAARVLSEVDGVTVTTAKDGMDAVDKLCSQAFDLVVTDLVMPRMTGLELTHEIRASFPNLPVVLMTAQGSETTAAQALRAGASNYVAKRDLAIELRPICESVLNISQRRTNRDALFAANVRGEVEFSIESDRLMASHLAQHLQNSAGRIIGCDGGLSTQIGVALEEALLNAVIHGNLEVGSELRELADGSYERLIAQRRTLQPYSRRQVRVLFHWSQTFVRFVIQDEGPGFDVETIANVSEADATESCCGRGILLMNAFMDEVAYNESGSEVTMIRYFERDPTVHQDTSEDTGAVLI